MAPSDPLAVSKPRIARELDPAVADGLRAVREPRVVLASCFTGVVSVRDDADGRVLAELRFPTAAWIDAVVFAPGRECVVACAQGLLRRWEIAGEPAELSVKQPLTCVSGAMVSRSGSFLATSIWNRDGGVRYPRLRVQDMATLQIVRQSNARVQGGGGHVAFRNAEDTLLAYDDGRLFEWDLVTGSERPLLAPGDVRAMAMHPTVSIAAVSVSEGYEVHHVHLIDAMSGERIGARVGPFPGIDELVFSPDGQYLVIRHLYWLRVLSFEFMRTARGTIPNDDSGLVTGGIGPSEGLVVLDAHPLPDGRLLVNQSGSRDGDRSESVHLLPSLEIERRRPMAGPVKAVHARS